MHQHRFLYSMLIACALLSSAGYADEAWLHSESYHLFHIVLPEEASPILQEAAHLFQEGWQKATDKSIRISTVNEGRYNVWLGAAATKADLISPVELEGLGQDGYIVRTFNPSRRYSRKGAYKQLLIVGESDTGVRNGVYAYFREVLYFCWPAPGLLSHRRATTKINEIDQLYIPLFSKRHLDLPDPQGEDFLSFRHAHALPEELAPRPGDTCFALLPPEIFHPKHPERYAEIEGKRIAWQADPLDRQQRFYQQSAQGGQICFGSPQSALMMLQELKKLIEAKPETASPALLKRRQKLQYQGSESIFSITPMEGLQRCQCPICRAIEAAEESPIGPLLLLLNRVAAGLEAAYPKKNYQLHTLAKGAYLKAPKYLRPHPNIIIEFCDEGSDPRYALDDPASSINTAYLKELNRWAQCSEHLYAWSCPAPLRNPIAPCPNFETLQATMQTYAQHAVESLRIECGGRPADLLGDMSAYRAFLSARLIWNPDEDFPQLEKDFFIRYYGKAQQEVRRYLALLKAAFEAHYDPAVHTLDKADWLPRDCLDELNTLFQKDYPEPIATRIKSFALSRAYLNYLYADTDASAQLAWKKLVQETQVRAGDSGQEEAKQVLAFIQSQGRATVPKN